MRKDEPVGNTCPTIDRVISTIMDVVKEMEYEQKNCDDPNLEGMLNGWQWHLEGLVRGRTCEMEEIREANASLRDWGRDWVSEASSLEEEVWRLEKEIEEISCNCKN
jgi:hypothetical protein